MPRLKDDFQPGDPICSVPAEWFNQVARWWNNLQCVNGAVSLNWGNAVITPFGNFSGGQASPKRWNAYASGDLELQILRGDVEFGGKVKAQDFPIIEWAEITRDSGIDSDGVVTIPTGNTTWWVWAEVDLRHPDEAVFIRHAETVEQLSDTEGNARWFETMLQKRIASVTIASDVMTNVVGDYQCGNIFIPRAAG